MNKNTFRQTSEKCVTNRFYYKKYKRKFFRVKGKRCKIKNSKLKKDEETEPV